MTSIAKPYCLLDSAIVLSEDAEARLKLNFNVEPFNPARPTEEQLERCEALLLHSRLPRGTLDRLTRCKYIGVRASNTDYVDRKLAEEKGIVVRGIEQASRVSVAEHTFALIFAVAKQLVPAHSGVVGGRWRDGLKPNYELAGKKLGIVGNGRIGKQVGAIGRALGMEVLFAGKPGEEKEGETPLERTIREADVITLHLSNKDNRVFFDRDKIRAMKPGAILVNTSRGSLLDEDALKESLLEGRLFGAGLDVFAEEPLRDSSLSDLPNVVCTPHVAFHTQETLAAMNASLISELERFYAKEQ